MKQKLLVLAFFLGLGVLSFILNNCGGTSSKKAPNVKKADTAKNDKGLQSGQTADQQSSCTGAAQCPDVSLTIESSGAQGTNLIANVNEIVKWTFTGAGEGVASQDLGMFIKLPASLASITQINYQNNIAEVSWDRPRKATAGTAPIQAIVRYVQRCVVIEKNEQGCRNLEDNQFSGYQKLVKFTYEIKDPTGGTVPGNSTLPGGGTYTPGVGGGNGTFPGAGYNNNGIGQGQGGGDLLQSFGGLGGIANCLQGVFSGDFQGCLGGGGGGGNDDGGGGGGGGW